MKRYNWSKIRLNLFTLPALTCSVFLSATVVSCAKEELKVTKLNHPELKFEKEYEFKNLSAEFKINNVKLNSFRDVLTSDLYINFHEFLTKLKGIFDLKKLKLASIKDGVYEYNINNEKIFFNAKTNQILMSSTDVFNITKQSQTTNYARQLKYLEFNNKKLSDEKYATLDLNNYGMTIKEIDGNIFLPFSIFNFLFLSPNYYNIYFNNDAFIGTTTTVNKDISTQEYNQVINNSRSGQAQSEKERVNSYNFLRFVFDNYYGLKTQFLAKKKAKNFDEYFAKTIIDNSKDEATPEQEKNQSLKERFLSTDIYTNTRAYEDFVYKELNELHTSIQSGSYFHPKNYRSNPYGGSLSQKVNDYIYYLRELKRIRNAYNAGEKDKIVSFHKDKAIIYLDIFNIATDEQLKEKDAYKYDSYLFMSKAMEMIKEHSKVEKINKIILDLSLNGGGSIAAMEKVAGFLTNKDLCLYFYETVNKNLGFSKYRVDVNHDDVYDEKDGYPDYQWYILSGINTFSAANLLTHIAKSNKLATIIGNKSGGGMYSILPIVLPDGTSLEISSNNAWVSYEGKEVEKEADLAYTQDGIEPDITIPYPAYNLYDVIDGYLESQKKGDELYQMAIRQIKVNNLKRELDNIKKIVNNLSELKRKEKAKKAEFLNRIEILNAKDTDTLDHLDEKIIKAKELFNEVIIYSKNQNKNQ